MNEEGVKFSFEPGKIVFRPIISHDETMTIYGKEQEFGEACGVDVEASIEAQKLWEQWNDNMKAVKEQ